MAQYSPRKIRNYFLSSNNASTMTEKGHALEDLICYLFEKVPGIPITRRNERNVFQSEEIDVAFWNDKSTKGFYFLPNIILVECKNWSQPIGSEEVTYFSSKVKNSGRDLGVLVAVNGITGSAENITAAHFAIARALCEGRQIIVLTKEEIGQIVNTTQLIELFKQKLCDLALKGTTLA